MTKRRRSPERVKAFLRFRQQTREAYSGNVTAQA
jgi:hypothetical protein